jgi:hypothetical protein
LILYRIRETPEGIFQVGDTEYLQTIGFVTESPRLITLEGKKVLTRVESYFKSQIKKTSTELMGEDFKDKIIKYQEIFPKLKLPSGKPARASLSNLETNFKWFFEKHNFSWDTIFKATEMYIDEYERKSPPFIYMRTSAYFIRKTELDKSIVSDLANYCETIQSGEGSNYGNAHFSEKVV